MKRLIIILSLICIGCQTASEYTPGGKKIEILFAEIDESATKSEEPGSTERSKTREEEKISTIDLFVFDAQNNLENRARFTSDIYQPKNVVLATPGDKTIYAIANSDGNIDLENLPQNDILTCSDIEGLEIIHKKSHTSIPYVLKAKQKIDLLTTPKIELKLRKIHAKIEIVNQTPEQLTISEIEVYKLPSKAYVFKTETPSDVEYNQKSKDTIIYTFATENPITVELTTDTKKIVKEFPRVVVAETNIINITKTDDSEIEIVGNDDWQGYQSAGVHHLGDISVVSSGASFSTDGTLLTYSNNSNYTLTLTAPNYTLSDLTLESNRQWAVVTGSNGTFNIDVQQTQQETERSAVLSIVKDNVVIKYILLTQAKKPIIYYTREPIQDNIQEKLADQLEVAGGAKSGILTVDLSAHETLAPFAMDLANIISLSNENLNARSVKINFGTINASQATPITNRLRIRRANNTEIASLSISQRPHQLSVPDFDHFLATNSASQTRVVTALGAAPGGWTATTAANWLSVTKQGDNLVIQPTNNIGAERTASVTITYDGTILEKTVAQFSGYSFTFATSDATMDATNGLQAYSIAKTYNVTITSSATIDFSTVVATMQGAPWTITQPTGHGTTGHFTITIPANPRTMNLGGQVSFQAGAQHVGVLNITQAMQVSFSQPNPFRIVGGATAPQVFINASPWDIASITTAPSPTAPLTITTDAAGHSFTVNAATSLTQQSPSTRNDLTVLSDKGEAVAYYIVTQEPVRFTIDNLLFNNLPSAATNAITGVRTTNNLEWGVISIEYNPTNISGWVTVANTANNTLHLNVAASLITINRNATVTLISRNTTSQTISLTQLPGIVVPNDVTIATQVWLRYNVGTTAGSLAISLSSFDFENSKGGYYVWSDAPAVCPGGYRLPSRADYNTLLANTTHSWLRNGTKLYLRLVDSTAPANTLEFSTAGYRHQESLHQEGGTGIYWSSDRLDVNSAWALYIFDGSASTFAHPTQFGASIRCIYGHDIQMYSKERIRL